MEESGAAGEGPAKIAEILTVPESPPLVDVASQSVLDAPSTDTTPSVVEVAEAPTLLGEEPSENRPSLAQSNPAASGAETNTDFIEVWRPSRRHEHQRKVSSEPARRRARRETQHAVAPASATPEGHSEVTAAPTSPNANEGERKEGRRGRRREHRKAATETERAPETGDRVRIDQRQRSARMQRNERGGRDNEHQTRERRADRPERDPVLRAKYIKGRAEGGTGRDREADPNSPFAKLARLKEQLEANTKEPR